MESKAFHNKIWLYRRGTTEGYYKRTIPGISVCKYRIRRILHADEFPYLV